MALKKLRGIILGGETGILSVKNSLDALNCDNDDMIILQDSTRPLVTEEIISKLLHSCNGATAVCRISESAAVIYITGDTYSTNDFAKLLTFPGREKLTKNDHAIIVGDFDGVWYGGSLDEDTWDRQLLDENL